MWLSTAVAIRTAQRDIAYGCHKREGSSALSRGGSLFCHVMLVPSRACGMELLKLVEGGVSLSRRLKIRTCDV